MPKHDSRIKVLLAGVCSLIVTLGIARFAYTPLIPVLQNQTGLSDSDAGSLAAINYIGYLAGVLLTAATSSLPRKDLYYRVGIILGVLSTAAMALSSNFIFWSCMRFIQGLSAASGLMIGTGLILHWLMRNNHKSAMGIHFSGMGLGIALSALLSNSLGNETNWQAQWLIFSVAGAILAIPAILWLPKVTNTATSTQTTIKDTPPDKTWLTLLVLAYGCAGVGYVISATFTVAIVERIPSLAGSGNMAWLIVGITAIPSVIIWEKVAQYCGDLWTLILAFALQTLGILAPLISESALSLFLSAFLYGATFIGIVGMVLTMVGKLYPSKPATVMGRLTLSFSIAQIIAPAAAGYFAQQQGNYNTSLWFAAIIMCIGIALLTAMVWHTKKSNNAKAAIS